MEGICSGGKQNNLSHGPSCSSCTHYFSARNRLGPARAMRLDGVLVANLRCSASKYTISFSICPRSDGFGFDNVGRIPYGHAMKSMGMRKYLLRNDS